jgi:hypothetical protein
MSHHYSGPDLGFPNGDARLDFCDLYAFPKPDDAGKSILVMNVHPSSTVSVDRSPDAAPMTLTTAEPFSADAIYELKIDTDGDSVADVTYRLVFSDFGAGGQTATLRLIRGSEASIAADDGDILIDGTAVSLDSDVVIGEGAGHRLFVGWRSDPFFFDPPSAFNAFDFSASKDFFADKDVCSIVLEVPNIVLGSGAVGVWARTMARSGSGWVQVDRGALAAQSVFLTNDRRDDYMAADPVDDAAFIPVFAHSLEHLGDFTHDEAERVATSLLPDMIRFDPSQPASYPKNGRALTDDIMGPFLTIITNSRVTSHGLVRHEDFIAEFPYLGPPHLEFAARPGSSTDRQA